MTEAERAQHAAALRGLLYLACPDAPSTAITETARAIEQGADEVPREPVPEARALTEQVPRPGDEQNLSGASLRDADLTRAALRGADLSGADLTRANLTRANLIGADLSDALLAGAYMRSAYLHSANLTRAYIGSAVLSHAFLTRANLTRAVLTEADLHRADLIRADLRGADLTGATLRGANLSGARLKDALGVHLPPGAVWNRETVWPVALESVVLQHSDEISPGVYQVHGGHAPDRPGAVRV